MTRKHLAQTFTGEDYDAMVFSSGGTTYTVETTNIDTGAKTKRKFKGTGAKDRAYEFAKEEVTK